MARRSHKKEMLQYIRENHEWSQAQVERAWEILDLHRCPLHDADEEIAHDIQQLLEDYCDENDLPTDAWLKYFCDEDEVWWEL